LVCTEKESILVELREDLKIEKGEGFLSGKEEEHLFQSIDFFNSRGGVPVFNLEEENPWLIKHSVKPLEDFSPILPALKEEGPT
tara:strand:+ start:256 stop:507 length:252 start_codon:yes stop_codon:yes gene_type:complete